MRLKKLRLHGFKSFADAAELDILSGLTGVVGPNGCGKSNLVEALRWAMGESSGRSLRAEDMDDVIFAGSGRRAGRTHAEVMIALEQDQPNALSQFADEGELEISRKIVREQGSTYRINGREVRARDVQLLFADGATGARSHAMIRQGQINELITDKPERRRKLLEDAAGISGLYTRRAESESRLKGARENLVRLDDLFIQLNTQIDVLERQAKTAAQYRIYAKEIHFLESVRLLEQFASLKAALLECQTQFGLAEQVLQDATLLQTQAVKAQAIAAAQLPNVRNDAAQKGSALMRLREELQNVVQNITRMETKIETFGERSADLLSHVERLEGHLEDAQKLLQNSDFTGQDEDLPLDDELQKAQIDREHKESALQKCELSVSEGMALYASVRSGRESLSQSIAQAQKSIQTLQNEMANLQELEDQVDENPQVLLEQLRQDYERLNLEAEQSSQKEADLKDIFEASQSQFLVQKQSLERLSEDEKHLNVQLHNISQALNAVEKQSGLEPVLLQMQVYEGFEKALSVALGSALYMPVAPTESGGWVGAERRVNDAPLPQDVKSLDAFVKAPDALQRALAQVGVVESLEQALALKDQLACGQSLVTKLGECVRWDGFLALTPEDAKATHLLDLKKTLTDYEAKQTLIFEQKDALGIVVSALERTCERDKQNWQHFKTLTQDHRLRLQSLQKQLLAQEKLVLDYESRQKANQDALVQKQQALLLLQTQLQSFESSLARMQDLESIENQLRERKGAQMKAREEAAQARGHVEALQQRIRMRITERENAIKMQLQAQKRYEALQIEYQDAQKKRQDVLQEMETLTKSVPLVLEQRLTLDRLVVDAERAYGAALKAQRDSENTLKDLDYAAKAALHKLEQCVAHKNQLQERQEKLRQDLAQLLSYIENEQGVTLSTHEQRVAEANFEKPASGEALLKRLRALQERRDGLGAVNLAAEKDLEEIVGRHKLLFDERSDLMAAIEKLESVIEELNAEGRVRFLMTYKAVSEKFVEVFTRLFGGGEAELKLVGHSDPLLCGLEVIAKPPGKKPQTLSLLSGGEQALVAVALLFAVFLTNPAPISVLDEVDAPLDDANVERFCDMLVEIARQTSTRFLVITHNPITMARMDRLYGVTMAEVGVSQLVSVDLGRAEALVGNGGLGQQHSLDLVS